MKRSFISVVAVLSVAGLAHADWNVRPLDTSIINTLNGESFAATMPERSVPGDTFGVFSGVASPAGNLFLLESSTAPVRDDIVTLGVANDPINDYTAAAGGVLRSVTSTVTDNLNGSFTIAIRIAGRNAAGAPADLFPNGFSATIGGVPTNLTSGAFGFGIGLPALLGGANPISISPFNNVISNQLIITTNGVAGAPSSLPTAFFSPSPANWNGVLGVSLGNAAASATDVTSDIEFRFTVIPAPGTAALLGIGGLVAARRRRA